MIDRELESTFPLKHANRHSGLDVSLSTWFRWASPGLQGVRLETVKVGGSTHTSKAAIQRFFSALTSARSGLRQRRALNSDREANVAHLLRRQYGL
jgi:hypothetical protein